MQHSYFRPIKENKNYDIIININGQAYITSKAAEKFNLNNKCFVWDYDFLSKDLILKIDQNGRKINKNRTLFCPMYVVKIFAGKYTIQQKIQNVFILNEVEKLGI
jgi:hypothetical protein